MDRIKLTALDYIYCSLSQPQLDLDTIPSNSVSRAEPSGLDALERPLRLQYIVTDDNLIDDVEQRLDGRRGTTCDDMGRHGTTWDDMGRRVGTAVLHPLERPLRLQYIVTDDNLIDGVEQRLDGRRGSTCDDMGQHGTTCRNCCTPPLGAPPSSSIHRDRPQLDRRRGTTCDDMARHGTTWDDVSELLYSTPWSASFVFNTS
jgi:hypothetical protein